ncbi:hypothetical protein DL93DRAFT_2164581 [Clavulina sp. PMI_390]|nr:hypothetical protein DL93DRAFT_2164581 [Clavulina sp. PMI_390]
MLIFAHAGSTTHNAVARDISIVNVNVSGFGVALAKSTGLTFPDLYNNTPFSPLEQGYGLRQVYRWGFYGYCGYINPASGEGVCTAEGNGSFAFPLDILHVIGAEIPPADQTVAELTIEEAPGKIKDSNYDVNTSKAGFVFVFFGTVATFLTFLAGLIRHNATFTIAFVLSIISTLTLLIGASIYTALIGQMQPINSYEVYSTSIGITVTYGVALWLIWASFAADLVAIFPYFLSWYTYRSRYAFARRRYER